MNHKGWRVVKTKHNQSQQVGLPDLRIWIWNRIGILILIQVGKSGNTGSLPCNI